MVTYRIQIKCQDHPRYRGVKYPTNHCRKCVSIYNLQHCPDVIKLAYIQECHMADCGEKVTEVLKWI